MNKTKNFFNFVFTVFVLSGPLSGQDVKEVGGLDFKGASITQGFGIDLPLRVRLQAYLEQSGIKIPQDLQGKNIFIGIDYFFPTAFLEFAEPGLDLDQKVKSILSDLLKKYDYVIVGDLFDPADLNSDEMIQKINLPESAPFLNLYNMATANGAMKQHLKIVNHAIREMASKDPEHLRVFSSVELVTSFLKGEVQDAQGRVFTPSETFQADQIHPNFIGQAVIISRLRFALEMIKDIEAFKKGLPAVEIKTLTTDEIATLISKYNPETNLKSREEKRFTGKVLDTESFRAPMITNEAKDSKTLDLQNIREVIQKTKSQVKIPPAIPILIRSKSDQPLEMNFKSILNFVNVTFEPDSKNPGEYVAYGSDLWFSVSVLNPPCVNYEFRVKIDESHHAIALKWTVLALFDGQKKTKKDKLDAQWIKQILKTLSDEQAHPYMVYELKIDLEDLK